MGAVFTAFLGVLLVAAETVGLSDGEVNGWIIAGFGIPGMMGFVLTWRYRIPLLVTGNAFIIIFIARLGTEFSWPELVGASLLAGVAVLIMVPLGLTREAHNNIRGDTDVRTHFTQAPHFLLVLQRRVTALH